MIAVILCALLLTTVSAAVPKSGRVVNGGLGSAELFPFIARLNVRTATGPAWCGGNLINDRWILTAAHCLHNTLSAQVGLGGNVRLRPIQVINVTLANMHIHPRFNPDNLDNDIAMIEIPRVTFSQYIKPIPLRLDGSETYANKHTFVAGWGKISGWSPLAPLLRFAEVKTLDNVVFLGNTADDKICIDTSTLGTSTCKGDSGGPLLSEKPNGQSYISYLIGVTSFGDENCRLGYVACFARVSHFLPWIIQTMGGAVIVKK